MSRNYLRFDKTTTILLIAFILMFIFIIILAVKLHNSINYSDDVIEISSPTGTCKCSNVLDYGVKGGWEKSHDTSNVISRGQSRVHTDKELRRALLLPDELHRADLR